VGKTYRQAWPRGDPSASQSIQRGCCQSCRWESQIWPHLRHWKKKIVWRGRSMSRSSRQFEREFSKSWSSWQHRAVRPRLRRHRQTGLWRYPVILSIYGPNTFFFTDQVRYSLGSRRRFPQWQDCAHSRLCKLSSAAPEWGWCGPWDAEWRRRHPSCPSDRKWQRIQSVQMLESSLHELVRASLHRRLLRPQQSNDVCLLAG
jgi:hypothetical protein